MGDRQALAEGRRRFASPDATYFSHVGKVGKRTLRGMKLSDLIAKGRRTVLKISPPKNPRFLRGLSSRQLGNHRRRVGIESPLRWRPLTLTRRLRQSLRPPKPAPLCGAVSRCPGSRAPTADERPGRRGSGDESAGITALAAPSETEGAESGAEARRCPCAGKRTLHFAVRPWGT